MIWEYNVIETQDQTSLGKMVTLKWCGIEGWELVTVTEEVICKSRYEPKYITTYYFKRVKQ